MTRRNLLKTIYPFLALLTLVPMVLLYIFSTIAIREVARNQTYEATRGAAYIFRNRINPEELYDPGYANQFCRTSVAGTQIRLTLMLPDGTVTGDSHSNPAELENHLFREEMQEALDGKEGFSKRYSVSLRMEMFYFALPVYNDGAIIAVIRASQPFEAIRSALKSSIILISIITLSTAVGIVLLSYFAARMISRPIRHLAETARQISSLEFDFIEITDGPEEIYNLSLNLHKMARILKQRFNEAVHQRKELEAIFSAIVEAIVVTDKNYIIKEINHAAAELFKLKEREVLDKPLIQVTRNSELYDLAEKTLEEKCSQNRTISIKEQIMLNGADDRNRKFTSRDIFLDVNTSIIETEDHSIRIIMAFHDVTRIKTLERIRKDFVANVSHELKTPVTSIMGFVETLKSGAINNRKDTLEFLDIIQTQSQRLDSIIRDLLSLSSLESIENTSIETEKIELKNIVSSSLKICGRRIEKKKIDVRLYYPDNLEITVNPLLMEQALVNLIDNAAKYCPEESVITITGERYPDFILISISDNGPGIPETDIPRVFERFYTVDKARSRELGGTGLGLSIVKHIILSHRGEIQVSSTEGEGTEFIIRLPS